MLRKRRYQLVDDQYGPERRRVFTDEEYERAAATTGEDTGPVTRTEMLESVEDLFDKLDVDNSGFLTREELEPLARSTGTDLMSILDEDSNEQITREEFRRYFMGN